MQEWADQQTHCTEQITQAEADQEVAAARTEELRAQAEEAQGCLPDIESKVRAAALSRDEMRGVLARVEQELALVAQSQRESDRQLQSLEQRQERLDQKLRGDRKSTRLNSSP